VHWCLLYNSCVVVLCFSVACERLLQRGPKTVNHFRIIIELYWKPATVRTRWKAQQRYFLYLTVLWNISIFSGVVQSTRSEREWVQVRNDQSVFSSGKIRRVWSDHEIRSRQPSAVDSKSEDVAVALAVEEGSVVHSVGHQTYVFVACAAETINVNKSKLLLCNFACVSLLNIF